MKKVTTQVSDRKKDANIIKSEKKGSNIKTISNQK